MKKSALVLCLAGAGVLAGSATPAIASRASHNHAHPAFVPRAVQEVVTLNTGHRVYRRPGGSRSGSVPGRTPITGERTALPVLRTVSRGRAKWLLVRLPGRPNGHTGWIHARRTSLWKDSWHILVSTGQRRAFVFHRGRLVHDWLVVVGAPGSPTPHGRFFVQENIVEPAGFPDGHYVLATSARSTVYGWFDGGPGQIALHGLIAGEGYPGMAASHGCVQFPSGELSWLAGQIPPGTPVTITS